MSGAAPCKELPVSVVLGTRPLLLLFEAAASGWAEISGVADLLGVRITQPPCPVRPGIGSVWKGVGSAEVKNLGP